MIFWMITLGSPSTDPDRRNSRDRVNPEHRPITRPAQAKHIDPKHVKIF